MKRFFYIFFDLVISLMFILSCNKRISFNQHQDLTTTSISLRPDTRSSLEESIKRVLENYTPFTTCCSDSSFIIDQADVTDYLGIAPEIRHEYQNHFEIQTTMYPHSRINIIVDIESYRRFRNDVLTNKGIPPFEIIRTEEFINFFNYSYQPPSEDSPFSLHAELASCPWNEENAILKIDVQGKRINTNKTPPLNVVFLLDFYEQRGEMYDYKLFMSGFKRIIDQLRPEDKIAVLLYTCRTDLIVPSTSAKSKTTLLSEIDKPCARMTFIEGDGLTAAYDIAKRNRVMNGITKVILVTNGQFQFGVPQDTMVNKIRTEKEENGIITVIFNFGCYQIPINDITASVGKDEYACIGDIHDAHRVPGYVFGVCTGTTAKNVDISIEFNSRIIDSYTVMDFRKNPSYFNDSENFEVGYGYQNSVLYELTLSDLLKRIIRSGKKLESVESNVNKIGTLTVQYENPEDSIRRTLQKQIHCDILPFSKTSDDFRFATAVAAFGLLLEKSPPDTLINYTFIREIVKNAIGNDPDGYKAEFLDLFNKSEGLSQLPLWVIDED